MAELTNYQCPNCEGRLTFNGELNRLQCEFCGASFTPQEVEDIFGERQAHADAQAAASVTEVAPTITVPASTGDPIQDYLARAKWDDVEVENMRAYNCPSCGAQLMVDQVTAVTQCPYCGNNTVVPGQLANVLKPDYVIPFKLDKNAAVAALKSYYQGKPLLPNSFTAENHIQEIQGVYVPFWLYTGKATGDSVFNAQNSRTWTDGNNMYTETDHYKLHRKGTMDFYRVPVDGSSKMPDAHMDAIEPYNYEELTPFSVAYLPGYLADRYDLDIQQCDSRARTRVENSTIAAMNGTAGGYMAIETERAKADVQWTDVAYALLPVWMLHTKWKGNDYLFAMNGQTGKLIGDLPIDQSKIVKRFILMFLPLAIVIAAVIFFVLGF